MFIMLIISGYIFRIVRVYGPNWEQFTYVLEMKRIVTLEH
jgi:hypothetical protein